MSLKLAKQVGNLLRSRGLFLATAESCTGGLVGDWITNIPGSSDYYLGGVVAYANSAKMELLGVPAGILAHYGAVSAEVVLEMARGARNLLKRNTPPERVVGLSVSGVAGPSGGTPEKPVGLVWVGLSGPDFERAYRFEWGGTRLENKRLSARAALQALADYLDKHVQEVG